jgi:hypothetical protein
MFYLCLYIKTRSSYPEIYPERSDEDEDGGYDLSRESQFINKWGGYTEIIWLLAGGDITKMKEIYKLNCHEFLYWAAIYDKRKVEVARLEKIIIINVKFICSNHNF